MPIVGPGGAAGGGSQPFTVIARGPFVVAHSAADILTGVPIYIPTVGEWLMNAMILPTIGFDGTTPYADIGPGSDGRGLFDYALGTPIPVDSSAVAYAFGNLTVPGVPDLASASAAGELLDGFAVIATTITLSPDPTTGGTLIPSVPARFNSTDPVTVWVTQNGQSGGADPVSTVGSLAVWLWTALPS